MDIETRRRDGVLEIEFNRPAKKNAFTAEMYAAMAAALEEAQGDKAVRVVLFHGTPEIFTAGNDIEDFIRRPPSGEDAPVFRFLRTVSRAPMPLVAAVNGAAVGIGTTLLLHCELVYAGENARFTLPFTSLGVVPEFASSYLLPQIAGYQRAAELLLLAQPFGPDQALAAGIVTRVLPPGETLEAARAAAARLASLPQKSVRLTKALMKSAHQAHIDAQLLTEGNHFRQLLGEPAAREAMAAFIEKRKPDFSRDN